jgi:two-component system response regulator RegA
MGEKPTVRNVLLVDDDPHLLTGWKRSAARVRGVTVFEASDATTARRLVSDEDIDLAVIDLWLGKESGIEIIRGLRKKAPEIKLALCSGYMSVATAVNAMRAGADTVLLKPITFTDILRRFEDSAKDDREGGIEPTPTLARAEWEHIMRVLADCNGNLTMAAQQLDVARSTLQRRLRKLAPSI